VTSSTGYGLDLGFHERTANSLGDGILAKAMGESARPGRCLSRLVVKPGASVKKDP
jgi:hypothetical protein